MRKSSKILIGALAVLIVALPLMSAVVAAEDNGQEPTDTDRQLRQRINRFLVERRLQQKQRLLIWFFKGAEKATLEDATIEAKSGNIAIVKVDEQSLNVVMPLRWYDETGKKVVPLETVLDEIGSYEVTLEVLKRTVTNDKGVSVTAYFCYEIDGYRAVLPFNID